MTADHLEDHVVGLELQLVELVEQKERALAQHDIAGADRIQGEIDALQVELVTTAERIAAHHV
ncbi:MAG TPA: hypothetical protein VMY34_05540 [Acidimicrobiales bacterium]|nr:hypothetical protein [Acidimicrobiales bacterium]